MDYRKLFKSKWFTASCFEGKPITLTIESVSVEVVENESGKEECPCIHFVGDAKPLVLNKTNARAIAGLHGSDANEWAGKEVTLRESVTTYRGEEVPCVRVKK